MIKGRKDCPVMIHNLSAGDIFADGNENKFVLTEGVQENPRRHIIIGLEDGKIYLAKPHDFIFPIHAEWSYE